MHSSKKVGIDRPSLGSLTLIICTIVLTGLRVYSAAPSLLERVVPATTSKGGPSDEVYDLMGYALPPGTIVGTQAWSMHRDATVFPSPDTFLPERWLSSTTNEAELEKMGAYMMPFGTGSRMCGGHNLAQMLLRMATAAFVRNFDISAPPETNEKSMDVKDSFVIILFLSFWPFLTDTAGDIPCRHGVQTHLHLSSTMIGDLVVVFLVLFPSLLLSVFVTMFSPRAPSPSTV